MLGSFQSIYLDVLSKKCCRQAKFHPPKLVESLIPLKCLNKVNWGERIWHVLSKTVVDFWFASHVLSVIVIHPPFFCPRLDFSFFGLSPFTFLVFFGVLAEVSPVLISSALRLLELSSSLMCVPENCMF